jgi:hypothetical protein
LRATRQSRLRFPTTDEKAALAGTAGTPDAGNLYVTDDDTRNADARTPTAHAHAESDVTNLGSDLAGKAASVHTHAEADVTNLASDLAGKAAAAHTHVEADVTSLVADLALKEPGSPVIWTTVVKASDQSIASSAVLTNDTELFFATVNGAVYEIEMVLIYGSPAGGGTPEIKLAYAEDGTARGTMHSVGYSTADGAQSLGQLVMTTSTTAWGTATGNRPIAVRGAHVGGGGTFHVMWAQSASGVNPTIMRAGSLLRYRRII